MDRLRTQQCRLGTLSSVQFIMYCMQFVAYSVQHTVDAVLRLVLCIQCIFCVV